MKKLLLLTAIIAMSTIAYAQKEITLKAGTFVTIKSTESVRASKVKVGQNLNFIVSRDIVIDGVTAIPFGSVAKVVVTKAKKSSWWGTKGRLGLKVDSVILPDGSELPLFATETEITGRNRTTLSVLLCLFVTWPACFITGSRAEMPAGYEINTQLLSTKTIKTAR